MTAPVTVAVLNAFIRPLLEGRLPGWVEPRYFASTDELYELAPQAEIGWFDSFDLPSTHEAARRAVGLKWLNTLAAGVDPFPLDLLRSRGAVLTNGAGLNAIPIAEYVVMGLLVMAKGYREVARSQERREWLDDAPGKQELHGSRVLVVGAGGIGGRTAELLRPWGVEVVEVCRRPSPGALGPDEWRARLGEFDWVVIAVPSTAETAHMFGAGEFAGMKRGAGLVNVARGAVLDQNALMAALDAGQVGAAFLDVTDPEPLPADHPLWGYDQVHITSHLSGRSQSKLFLRAAERFLENLGRWERGEDLVSRVDLTLGY